LTAGSAHCLARGLLQRLLGLGYTQPRLRGITVPKASHTTTIACVLNLHADAIGIIKMELLCVAALRNLCVELQRPQFGEYALRVDAID
jgi:hypothetical protein